MSIGTVGRAIRLVDTRQITDEQWKQERRRGIGGSAIAAIAGVHPYSSPLQAYLEIVGEWEPEENEPMHWGKLLEPVVADEFAHRHPEYRVERVNAILQHPDEPIFLANIDRRVLGDKRGPGVLEVKTASAWTAGRWRDDVPDYVTCQCQWYLGITGYSWAVVAALIGGNHYAEFSIERDDEIIGYLHQIGKRFWEEHVIPRVPPAIEAGDLSTIEAMHPTSNGETIDLPPDALSILSEYDAAKEAEKAARQRREDAEAKLKALLGDYEAGYAGDRLVSWKTIVSQRLDTKRLKAERPDIYGQYVQESSYRRFEVRRVG